VKRRDPVWLLLEAALAIQDQLIAEHGGVPGLRDRGLLESALEAPRHLAAYAEADLHALAARYAFGISRNHPFVDGNKRAAFSCSAVFLLRNGWRVTARPTEVVEAMQALADRRLDETGFARWLRDHTRKARAPSRRSDASKGVRRPRRKRS
jgi:death-on-curing protein